MRHAFASGDTNYPPGWPFAPPCYLGISSDVIKLGAPGASSSGLGIARIKDQRKWSIGTAKLIPNL